MPRVSGRSARLGPTLARRRTAGRVGPGAQVGEGPFQGEAEGRDTGAQGVQLVGGSSRAPRSGPCPAW